ncbi:hypothetical protein D3C87_1174690 [compost metagenome]
MLKTEVLQQTHRGFELFGQQRLFERTLPVFLGAEPLARAAMPGTTGRTLFVTHGPGQGHVDAQPVDRVFPGLDETAHVLQSLQRLCAFTGAEQMLAQAGIESR